MRIVSGACDAIHAVVKSDDRTVSHRSLQSHVVHALLGCLSAGEVPSLGVGDVAEKYRVWTIMISHDIRASCESIVIR
jgi:hypothetical protein